jgi:hypothetical protein
MEDIDRQIKFLKWVNETPSAWAVFCENLLLESSTPAKHFTSPAAK